MTRDTIGALGGLVVSLAFFAIAVPVLGWVALATVEPETGVRVATWAARQAPVMGIEPGDFGNRVVNAPTIWIIGVLGLIALMSGLVCLRDACHKGEDDDHGEPQLELTDDKLRVGWPLQGQIVLASKDEVGQPYNIRVECRRMSGRRGKAYRTDYESSVEVVAVAGEGGARVPFRFEIPLTAPPSREWVPFSLRDPCEWQLVFARPKAWFRGSFFALQVEPGPEEEVAEALAAMPPVVVGALERHDPRN